MKVLLLNPPFMPKYSRSSRSPCVTKGGTFYYPYYLAYATGVLDEEGFDVTLKDAIADEMDEEETLEYVRELDPDLVVVDTAIPSFDNDVTVAERIKEETGAHVNLVGNHSMDMGEAFDISEGIDSVCRDEYDYTVRDLARALEDGEELDGIKGLSYKEGEEVVDNEERERIEDLDELPWVSKVYKEQFGIEGIKKYFYASLRHPQVTIMTARGCPHNCSFCPMRFKASYRTRSPEDVVEEFKWIEENLPEVKEVMIEDGTFPIDEERTKEICDMLIEEDLDLKWSCNARVDMEKQTLEKMKEAGCRLMCVGFEAPSQEVLDEIHKRTTEEMQMKFMENCIDVGILVNGCFILGLPNDTEESMERTIEFAKDLNPDTAQFYPLMCYPDTEAWDWAKENDMLDSEEFSALLNEEGGHHTNVKGPDNMSPDELVEWCDKARKEFYIRREYIWHKLKQSLASWEEAKRTAKSAKTFFSYLWNMIRG